MHWIKETSSASQTLASESAVRLSGLETRSVSLEETSSDVALHVNQLSVQLHTLHSVTVARLGGLEEILQRLVHQAEVSAGDVTAHAAPGSAQPHDIERIRSQNTHTGGSGVGSTGGKADATHQLVHKSDHSPTAPPTHPGPAGARAASSTSCGSGAFADGEASSSGQPPAVAQGLATGLATLTPPPPLLCLTLFARLHAWRVVASHSAEE